MIAQTLAAAVEVHWRSKWKRERREGGEREQRTEQKLRSSQKTLSGFSLSGWGIGGVRDANNDSESDAATVNVKCQARERERGVPVDYFVNEEDQTHHRRKLEGREGVRGDFSRNWSIGQSVHCAAVTLASIRVQDSRRSQQPIFF